MAEGFNIYVFIQVSDSDSIRGQNSTLLKLLKFSGIATQTDLVSSNLKAKATCIRARGALKLFTDFLLPQLKVKYRPQSQYLPSVIFCTPFFPDLIPPASMRSS